MITRRNHTAWYKSLAVFALLALVGLDAIYVMHYAVEGSCDAAESGDPYDCFICTSLFTLGLDLPYIASLPEPIVGVLLPVPEEVALAPRLAVRRAGARSPPQVLV